MKGAFIIVFKQWEFPRTPGGVLKAKQHKTMARVNSKEGGKWLTQTKIKPPSLGVSKSPSISASPCTINGRGRERGKNRNSYGMITDCVHCDKRVVWTERWNRASRVTEPYQYEASESKYRTTAPGWPHFKHSTKLAFYSALQASFLRRISELCARSIRLLNLCYKCTVTCKTHKPSEFQIKS